MKRIIPTVLTIALVTVGSLGFAEKQSKATYYAECGNKKEFVEQMSGFKNPVKVDNKENVTVFSPFKNGTLVFEFEDGSRTVVSFYQDKMIAYQQFKEASND